MTEQNLVKLIMSQILYLRGNIIRRAGGGRGNKIYLRVCSSDLPETLLATLIRPRAITKLPTPLVSSLINWSLIV